MTSERAQAPDDAVLVSRRGAILIVTLNRPEARNAVNLAVHRSVGAALQAADGDPSVWVVIITGAGDRAFCSGADLRAAARGEPLTPQDPVERAWGFAGYVAHHISKPTIAAVNGFALGGGTEIVLASDLAVAADTATFGLPEVKRGIFAGGGGAFRLPAQIPQKLAMEMLLTGEAITADRALALGLVNAVVPASQVLAEALMLAERITANAPLSVQASKRVGRGIIAGEVTFEAEAWARSDAEVAAILRSQDAREGAIAFAEKRAPRWTAR